MKLPSVIPPQGFAQQPEGANGQDDPDCHSGCEGLH
jgi:hypothetical protein